MADQRRIAAGELQDAVRDVEVGHLIAAAHVVDLAGDAVFHGRPDARAVVLDVDPVADLLPVAVHRQLLAVEGVGDEQRDELLGVLARSVGVRSARDDGVDAERAVPGEHLQVAPGLAGRVWAGRLDRVGLVEGAREDRAVDLVGGDLDEPPHAGVAGRVQQDGCTHHIGVDEVAGAQDRAVHVALGGEVHHHVHAGDGARDGGGVGDVGVHERVGGVAGDVGDVGRVAGVGELVEVHHLGPTAQRHAHERGTDEAAAAGDQDPHIASKAR